MPDDRDAVTLETATPRMLAHIEGAIGWMVFNNPERRNAVSLDMWAAIPAIMDRFEQDPAVRAIVLRGAGGRAFVSGADISQFETERATPEGVAAYDRVMEEASRRMTGTGKPMIAMIEGFCIGGGLAIAAGCDLRIAGEGSRFAVPAARLGLGYQTAGVKRLLDLVGGAHVMEIFFTARQFSAAEALGMGLVNRVVPADELESFVRDYAGMIAENAPLTMLALKRSVGALLGGGQAADMAECAALVRACFDSADYIEGRRAFMEKRRPAFTGR
jgi:enoyl-CoA hydratase/carnithine racemase